MASFLPHEILRIIFDEYADDPFMLHSCILVNRSWCIVALPYLWAKPFTLLHSIRKAGGNIQSISIENLIATFIECFTDIDSVQNSLALCKKHNKEFPFDYSLYLKEIHFKEIHALGTLGWCTGFNSINVQFTHLAVVYCPNLTTLSLTFNFPHQVAFSIKQKWTLPYLQNLSLPLNLYHST